MAGASSRQEGLCGSGGVLRGWLLCVDDLLPWAAALLGGIVISHWASKHSPHTVVAYQGDLRAVAACMADDPASLTVADLKPCDTPSPPGIEVQEGPWPCQPGHHAALLATRPDHLREALRVNPAYNLIKPLVSSGDCD